MSEKILQKQSQKNFPTPRLSASLLRGIKNDKSVMEYNGRKFQKLLKLVENERKREVVSYLNYA